MSTAGWPKLQAGWLDPSTAAVHGFVTNVLVAFDRHGLLVETAANAPFTRRSRRSTGRRSRWSAG